MLSIQEPGNRSTKQSQRNVFAVFDLLFRSHFLLAALSSIVGLVFWLSFTTHGMVIGGNGLTPTVWHINEMMFSFASTVAVGFILTAVQTWTGQPSIKGKAAGFIVLLWVIAQLLFWFNTRLSISLALMVKSTWWLSVILSYSKIVFRAKNRRNYLFIPLMIIMAVLNGLIIILDLINKVHLAIYVAKSMVLLFTLVVAIVAGRVIPFFTANGAKLKPISNHALLDYIVFAFTIVSIVCYFTDYFYNLTVILGTLLTVLGALHLIRLSRWQSFKTLHVPLLWSLHLAYAFMGLGLIVSGLSYLTELITLSQGIHLITLGCIGLMILSMMSRVSLGHTGRMLTVKPSISLAFILMVVATLIRVILPSFGLHVWSWAISGVLWMISFAIFLWVYTPILTKPRIN